MRRGRRGDADDVRRVTERLIRRLDLLEYAILGAAALLALVAGALAALLLNAAARTPFRITWAVMSILFFVVPAAATWLRARQEERPTGRSASHTTT